MRKDVSKEIESDATPPEVLFVLKTSFFAKKKQKQEILAKAIEMAATEMPMVYRYYEKSRTSAADGTSFRGCLSDGDDIFSKSIENQGGANRTFATGGRSWRVWQHYVTSHAPYS